MAALVLQPWRSAEKRSGMLPDYVLMPPEVNSARIYAGPRSGSMWAAAAAWDVLATELSSAASSFQTAVSTLGGSWQGPSALAMATAAVPYVQWLSAASAQAEQAAGEARLSAGAFDVAFIATVAPPLIAANRAQLTTLIATNILGQNTAAIAATEATYTEMWAQDVAAMTGYDASTAAVQSQWTSFSAPPPDLAGSTIPVQSTSSELFSPLGQPSSLLSTLQTSLSQLQMLSTPAELAMEPMNMAMGQIMTGANPLLGGATDVVPAMTPALLPATGPALPSLGTTALMKPPIPALMGQANSIGALSVPATWPDSAAVAGPAHTVAAPSGAAIPSVSTPGRPYLPSIGSPSRGLAVATPAAITAARAGALRRGMRD
ncbi:PPE family protein [Mycobacterium shigaense]|uniref:PPE family protein n=1 Tax=Mycobacterium shigaense TaxID=722731 RepID=UPI0013C348A8|nr:PPE family protein [Mycobacterium shigaense]